LGVILRSFSRADCRPCNRKCRRTRLGLP